MAKDKIGRNKKACEKYRMQGRLFTNKKKKQEREEKRKARFKVRRESGKTYEYKSPSNNKERLERAEKQLKSDHRTEFQKLKSIFDIQAKEIAEKKAKWLREKAKKENKKVKSPHE